MRVHACVCLVCACLQGNMEDEFRVVQLLLAKAHANAQVCAWMPVRASARARVPERVHANAWICL